MWVAPCNDLHEVTALKSGVLTEASACACAGGTHVRTSYALSP